MVFRLSNTFNNPASPASLQRGFPAPGNGAQTTGPVTQTAGYKTGWTPARPIQGKRSWFNPSKGQRGFPAPLSKAQEYPKGLMNEHGVVQTGMPVGVVTPYYDRGAAAVVQNFGKILTNPIGAGVVARYTPQASYGPPVPYHQKQIYWNSQSTPTSIRVQGLSDAQDLAAYFNHNELQAVIRTRG